MNSNVVLDLVWKVCCSHGSEETTEEKSVFCIDNISTECTLESFVSAMSVNVVSCYEVKPRRRPSEHESDVMDRKAFRLCIDAEDCDRLLNADIWPDSVVIAEWFFQATTVWSR